MCIGCGGDISGSGEVVGKFVAHEVFVAPRYRRSYRHRQARRISSSRSWHRRRGWWRQFRMIETLAGYRHRQQHRQHSHQRHCKNMYRPVKFHFVRQLSDMLRSGRRGRALHHRQSPFYCHLDLEGRVLVKESRQHLLALLSLEAKHLEGTESLVVGIASGCGLYR